MSAVLDELHRAYKVLLLHGAVPTGVVIDPADFVAVCREARLRSRPAPAITRPSRYTLDDLRAL